jgi:hypothetical protein
MAICRSQSAHRLQPSIEGRHSREDAECEAPYMAWWNDLQVSG